MSGWVSGVLGKAEDLLNNLDQQAAETIKNSSFGEKSNHRRQESFPGSEGSQLYNTDLNSIQNGVIPRFQLEDEEMTASMTEEVMTRSTMNRSNSPLRNDSHTSLSALGLFKKTNSVKGHSRRGSNDSIDSKSSFKSSKIASGIFTQQSVDERGASTPIEQAFKSELLNYENEIRMLSDRLEFTKSQLKAKNTHAEEQRLAITQYTEQLNIMHRENWRGSEISLDGSVFIYRIIEQELFSALMFVWQF